MRKLLLILLPIMLLFSACQPDDLNILTSQADTPSVSAPEARDYVNGLTYTYGVSAPALEAFRAVTADRGWAVSETEKWVPFVENVILGESGGCPNVRRGARVSGDCVVTRQGTGSDSGFGQVISLHYRYPKGWLCKQEGLCSSAQIIGTPYDSMTALVALVERSGGQPWCFSSWARRYHKCSLVPR